MLPFLLPWPGYKFGVWGLAIWTIGLGPPQRQQAGRGRFVWRPGLTLSGKALRIGDPD